MSIFLFHRTVRSFYVPSWPGQSSQLRRGPIAARQGLERSMVTSADSIQSDTIYALSSGPMVKCGIAVVRISGPQSLQCIEALTDKTYHKSRTSNKFGLVAENKVTFSPRKSSLRKLYCPKSGDMLDQALLLWFPRPNSFTGEDIVELHLHGSRAVVLGIFNAMEVLDEQLRSSYDDATKSSSQTTIRPAERGEFTRRAFFNGKMDLTAVEGLADLLDSDTSEQRKQALNQMDGFMLNIYERWRSELIRSLAHTEAVIDFGDDDRESDVDDGAMWALVPRIEALRDELIRYLRDGRRGEIVREGIKIALVGPPNAGKSSLINALAKRPLAIVSPIAGTTRDIVEVRMDLGGISCTICDTAGLRQESGDPIEREGMRRAREAFQKAQVKIFVCDVEDMAKTNESSLSTILDELTSQNSSKTALQDDDSDSEQVEQSKTILVMNKIDLLSSEQQDIVKTNTLQSKDYPQYLVSCSSGSGLSDLEQGMTRIVQEMFASRASSGEGVLITRERHRRHMKECLHHLENFLDQSLSMDLAAEELRLAMQEIGKVTGRVDVEEILDVLFRDFCIGK